MWNPEIFGGPRDPHELDGVMYESNINDGLGYKFACYSNETGNFQRVPLESLVSPEGMEYLDRAINAAPESESYDVMRRIGEYVIEAFPA